VTSSDAKPVTIVVDDARKVSGLLLAPPRARACYLFAHGAGAGMTHPFMAAVAAGLEDRDIATLRYQFPYMEQRARRHDLPSWRTRPFALLRPKRSGSCPDFH
jgi:uncharacterized protein